MKCHDLVSTNVLGHNEHTPAERVLALMDITEGTKWTFESDNWLHLSAKIKYRTRKIREFHAGCNRPYLQMQHWRGRTVNCKSRPDQLYSKFQGNMALYLKNKILI